MSGLTVLFFFLATFAIMAGAVGAIFLANNEIDQIGFGVFGLCTGFPFGLLTIIIELRNIAKRI
jgi:hypothetical protein